MKNIFRYSAVTGWLLLSLVSLVAMYHLWWTRERVLYLGRTAQDKAKAVIARSGLPEESALIAAEVSGNWPQYTRYTARGSEVALSYTKYLILPRIPDGSTGFKLIEQQEKLSWDSPIDVKPVEESSGGVREFRAAFGLFFSVLIMAGLGVFISRLLTCWRICEPEAVTLAIIITGGLGVLSRGYIGWIGPAFGLAVILGILGIIQVLLRVFRQGGLKLPGIRSVTVGVLSVCLVAASFLFWCLIMAVVAGPDDWDAWAQWGPKAHILVYGRGPMSDVQYFVPGSGDYPLLWPALWAFSAWCSGGWEDQWAKGWGAVLLMLVAWQMAVVIRQNGRDGNCGFFIAALYLSMPAVPLIGSWAYAEPLFLLTILCALGRLLSWREQGRSSDLVLASCFIAGASFTKNEGLLFAVVCLIWVLLQDRASRPMLAFVRLFFGTLTLYMPWLIYKWINIQTQNHVLGGGSFGELALRVYYRFSPALEHVAKIWIDVKQWNIVVPVVVLGGLFCSTSGVKARRDLMLPVMLLSGYFFVMLIHPADVNWQIGVAWNRLSLHIFALSLIIIAIHGRLDLSFTEKCIFRNRT